MTSESGAAPEDWKSGVTVPLCKCKREGSECKNDRGISLFSEAGKIYAGILVDRVLRVTSGLIDGEQGASERGGGMQIRSSTQIR